MSRASLFASVRRPAAAFYDAMRTQMPDARRRRREADDWANTAMSELRDLETSLRKSPPLVNSVLWDGMWENPNYWIRLSLVRAALGAATGRETGVIGPWQRDRARRNFAALGIERIADGHREIRVTAKHVRQAQELIAASRDPADVFDWDLPFGFPGTLLFDGILKRQRLATVKLDHPDLPRTVTEAIAAIEAADRIVEDARIDLAVLSHALDYMYGAVAWAALRRGVPVLVLYGDYGTARFIHMDCAEDLFAYPGRPTREEIETMPGAAQRSLAEAGGTYLQTRLAGGTDDVSAIYAFQRREAKVDRDAIAAAFGWDSAKPMIAVYGANWFDFPHVTGLTEYRDFLDWITTTLDIAVTRTDVNWIVKAHPVDDWYGIKAGTGLDDITRALGKDHVRVCARSWNGSALLAAVDGLVCCHSTAGLEAGALGKPVLVAHRGWYGDAGFTHTARTRAEYRALLTSDWWRDHDPAVVAALARLFAGWYFAVPDWHGGYLYPDDSEQAPIYARMPDFLAAYRAAIAREVTEIRDWYLSGHRFYHIFKMTRADRFRSIVRGAAPEREAAE